jgi:hypothetical protein
MKCRVRQPGTDSEIMWVRKGSGITVIQRTRNEGMDFAAHNTSITYAMSGLQSFWLNYSYYVFLNSSVKGPFVPKYFVGHWSQPYTDRIRGSVKAVASSIVCLPSIDAGEPLSCCNTAPPLTCSRIC